MARAGEKTKASSAKRDPVADRNQRRSSHRPEERIHLNVGPVCNNNCLFCMEEDRRDRRRVNGALTPDHVRTILQQARGAREVCFTSGEPTLVQELPRYVGWARSLGYPRVSVMTNGRRLAYADYCARLVLAGISHFYLSIHGHEARLHDGLVRTPGAFAQTVAGLRNVARHTSVTLHTSTVVNSRNYRHFAEIYPFLRDHGVTQVVFNVMQATGRAHTHFERLFLPYPEIAAAFGRFLEQLEEPLPPVFLVDIPPCATERLPQHNRGILEAYVHYEVGAQTSGPGASNQDPSPHRVAMEHGELVQISRADHDTWQRSKRPECSGCVHDAVCPGVWNNYLARHGWVGLDPSSTGS